MTSSPPPGDADDPLIGPAAAPRSDPADGDPAAEAPLVREADPGPVQHRDSHNMLPPRDRRRSAPERLFVRLIATGGIIGIGVAIGAIMTSSHSQGWLIGVVVSVVSVLLAAILWSSRQL
jgi:hypothetical protein